MRPHSHLFRLTASTAIAALLLGPVLPTPALAQMGPAVVAASQQQSGDPPARVGRLAHTTGSVSFHTAEAEEWSPAQANYPVTSGDVFWTEPNAQAELQIGGSRIQLAGGTEFTVGLLDQTGVQATQDAGEVYLRLRGVAPGEAWSVQTPRGTVMLSGDGRYAIAAGDMQTPTTVTVLEGGAQVSGPGLDLQIGPGQAATIDGTDTFQGSIGPAQPDAFVNAMLASERPPQSPAMAPPPIVASMPGGDDLAAYGTWSDSPEYGAVWYPQVAVGWVPYREGHWAWVPPWGWTWVDDAPWGFTPFHYGRWILIGARWAWTPGVVAVAGPPVYAPALVTFFGIGAGVAIGAALASGTIGWCPLGPREAYHPWVPCQQSLLARGEHSPRQERHHDQPHRGDRPLRQPLSRHAGTGPCAAGVSPGAAGRRAARSAGTGSGARGGRARTGGAEPRHLWGDGGHRAADAAGTGAARRCRAPCGPRTGDPYHDATRRRSAATAWAAGACAATNSAPCPRGASDGAAWRAACAAGARAATNSAP